MGYIYKIENKINGKIYIGETARTPERRWYEHIFYSMAAGSHRHALQNAIRNIRTYRSIKEAKEITGASKIGMVCNGKRTQSGGYIWKFIEK